MASRYFVFVKWAWYGYENDRRLRDSFGVCRYCKTSSDSDILELYYRERMKKIRSFPNEQS